MPNKSDPKAELSAECRVFGKKYTPDQEANHGCEDHVKDPDKCDKVHRFDAVVFLSQLFYAATNYLPGVVEKLHNQRDCNCIEKYESDKKGRNLEKLRKVCYVYWLDFFISRALASSCKI